MTHEAIHCPRCHSEEISGNGHNSRGSQSYMCRDCGQKFVHVLPELRSQIKRRGGPVRRRMTLRCKVALRTHKLGFQLLNLL
ncbi:MAG: hypothetical protein HC824_00490 [Synechococcales cyanobacterium RM1_1_8]|nr:hypothetical protein [Synechococcales cyanobacterium RM1_1_8]